MAMRLVLAMFVALGAALAHAQASVSHIRRRRCA